MPWPLDPAYTVCHADAGPVAGIMEIPADLPAEVPSHWLQYIGTRDVDGTAEAAVRAGGSIVKAPSDMQGAGRYAVLKDPQGAVFAIIDPENARPESAGTPPLGTFSWHELATSDNEAAFAFYSGLFGWDAMQRMDMGPDRHLPDLRRERRAARRHVHQAAGHARRRRTGCRMSTCRMPTKGYELATATGAQGPGPPMDVPGGSRIADIIDPAGARVCDSFHAGARPMAAEPPKAESAKAKAKAKGESQSRRRNRGQGQGAKQVKDEGQGGGARP